MTDQDKPQTDPDGARRLSEEAWAWVFRITSGAATGADVTALQEWCARSPRHAREYARVSRRWRSLGPAFDTMSSDDKAAAVERRGLAGFSLGRRAILGGAVTAAAAGAAVLVARPPLGLWPSLREWQADYRTAVGQQQRIERAAASIEMNTRTSLNIRSVGDAGDRIELVSGEAVIAARSGNVEVIAGDGRMAASTAEFNVRCEGTETRVTCISGSVHVVRQGQSIDLRRGEQVAYLAQGSGRADLGPPQSVDAEIVTGWRRGYLYFENETLSRVVDEINRYRPGRIVVMNDELGRRRYTASFKLDRLSVVVPQLQTAFGARVRQLPGGFVLLG
jgi:transmembrane sensor